MKFTRAVLLASLTTAVTAAGQSGADTTATKAALIAADTALARQLSAIGPDALIDLLEPNAAVLMPENPILRGPEEARDALRSRYGAPSRYTWHVMHVIASLDDGFGCTVGIIRFRNAKDEKPEERGGVYEACWRRDRTGKWKIVGLQSSDDVRPRRSLLYLVGKPLEKAPHSATISRGDDQLYAALEADARFASMAAQPEGPGPAFVAFAASDAISMIAPDSVRGHAELEAFFAGISRQFALLWSPDRSLGAGSGGLAFTVGRSVRIPIQGQKVPERHGKFLTIWRQNPDGSWSWILDLGSLRRWQQN